MKKPENRLVRVIQDPYSDQNSMQISKILVEAVKYFTTDNPLLGAVCGRKQNLVFYDKNVEVAEFSLPFTSE